MKYNFCTFFAILCVFVVADMVYGEIMAFPKDCTKYQICDYSGCFVFDCAPGTEFNPKVNVCDYPLQDRKACTSFPIAKDQNLEAAASNQSPEYAGDYNEEGNDEGNDEGDDYSGGGYSPPVSKYNGGGAGGSSPCAIAAANSGKPPPSKNTPCPFANGGGAGGPAGGKDNYNRPGNQGGQGPSPSASQAAPVVKYPSNLSPPAAGPPYQGNQGQSQPSYQGNPGPAKQPSYQGNQGPSPPSYAASPAQRPQQHGGGFPGNQGPAPRPNNNQQIKFPSGQQSSPPAYPGNQGQSNKPFNQQAAPSSPSYGNSRPNNQGQNYQQPSAGSGAGIAYPVNPAMQLPSLNCICQ